MPPLLLLVVVVVSVSGILRKFNERYLANRQIVRQTTSSLMNFISEAFQYLFVVGMMFRQTLLKHGRGGGPC